MVRPAQQAGDHSREFSSSRISSAFHAGARIDVITEHTLPFRSDTDEERRVNALAGRLLLPKVHLKSMIDTPLIDPSILKRIARTAGVSPTMAACRIAASAQDLGLKNAAVLGFEGETLRWVWSKSLDVTAQKAARLLTAARQAAPRAFRSKRPENVLTASLLGSPRFPAVFVQLLPAELATRPTPSERIRDLADALFSDDASFRHVINGCISAFKTRHAGQMNLPQAVDEFIVGYAPRLNEEQNKRLKSMKGLAFLEAKLSQWFVRPDPK